MGASRRIYYAVGYERALVRLSDKYGVVLNVVGTGLAPVLVRLIKRFVSYQQSDLETTSVQRKLIILIKMPNKTSVH